MSMLALRDVQLALARCIVAGDDAMLSHHVAANSHSDVRARLAVYRNNWLANCRNALADVYPALQRLVGEAFFRHVAEAFILEQPSTSGDLNDFGEPFGDFLGQHPAARDLEYLPDVARLEWAVHRVLHAAAAQPVSIEALAAVPADRLGELRFDLHPAARLIRSQFPIVRIWEVNQPGYLSDQTVRLDEGAACALIRRNQNYAVEVHTLSYGAYAMLTALDCGHSLAGALEDASRADEAFDLRAFL